MNERAKSLSDPTEFYREFGTGPSLDCSATSFEIKPDSFNDTDSLMDGNSRHLWCSDKCSRACVYSLCLSSRGAH